VERKGGIKKGGEEGKKASGRGNSQARWGVRGESEKRAREGKYNGRVEKKRRIERRSKKRQAEQDSE
jgi:hypothetical protein